MDSHREALYRSLGSEIGHTPLYRIQRIEIPYGNVVFAKEENKNPGGSHYDRVFVRLFRHYEEEEKIIPGHTPVVETTSGSAGVSFARLGRLLGYECLVVCPADLPETRLRAIKEQEAEVRLTPKGEYVDGSAKELERILREENRQRKADGKVPYFALNHTQNHKYGNSALMSAEAVEVVVDEAVVQAAKEGVRFDRIVSAAGNGTTALGFGRAAKRHGIRNIIWEPLGCGVYYDRVKGNGSHQNDFGISPGDLGYHDIYGVHFKETPYPLINVDQACEEHLIHDVVVVVNDKIRDTALKVVPERSHKVIVCMQSLDRCVDLLRDVEGKPVGRSSAGNIATVLDTQWGLRNMNILTFFYDDLSRY